MVARVALLAVGWAALCAAVVATGWAVVDRLDGSVGSVDTQVALWLAGHRTDDLSRLAEVGQVPGNTVTGQVVLVLVAVGFSVLQRSPVPALFVALVEAGLLGIYFVATSLVPRMRPPVEILDPGLVPDRSFPSGHVAMSVAICGSVVVLTWAYRPALRWWPTPLLLVPLVVVAVRTYQGAHYLSDALTSLVAATVWLGLVTIALLRSRPGP